MSLWIVDGGMVELPVVARVEDWEEGSYIEVTGSNDGAKWNDAPIRYVAERTCFARSHHSTRFNTFGTVIGFECSKCAYVLTQDPSGPILWRYCPNCGARVVE